MIYYRKCFGKRDSTRDRKKGIEIKVSYRIYGFMWLGIFIERERGGKRKREKLKECKVGINKLMLLVLINILCFFFLMYRFIGMYLLVLFDENGAFVL